MLITIIAWIVLIVSGLVLMIDSIGIFTSATTKKRLYCFGDAIFYSFTIMLALRFIYG
ncbi:hypothetical protein [Intestinibacter bartlettii]|jgi:hypothetical protein|uniref:hypothetical protein n=1 Tax=Intestinibacter bartlettii TaxID=261299 RepID=UPI003AB27F7D